jgi:hypothetical protein
MSAEFPVQLLTKRYGFKYVLPTMMTAWSMVCKLIRLFPPCPMSSVQADTFCHPAWAQAFMTNRAGFYVTRALIGACEGGFIPGVILFATYFYTSKELSLRLAAFWSTLNVARKTCFPSELARVPYSRGHYRRHHGSPGCWYPRDARHCRQTRLVLVVPPRGPLDTFDRSRLVLLPAEGPHGDQDAPLAQALVH